MKIALIGLGAIGVPIADKLFQKYRDDFLLIADNERKAQIKNRNIQINHRLFNPQIVSEDDQPIIGTIDILLVCVKNYGLNNILRNVSPFIEKKTIIIPLQNGIFAYDFFRNHFADNIVLRGYVQGPNTEMVDDGYKYENPGD